MINEILSNYSPTQKDISFSSLIFEKWNVGEQLVFHNDNIGLHFCNNGNNMRWSFWRDILPQISDNMLGSIVFVRADMPEIFKELQAILAHNYTYDMQNQVWGSCFLSPPLIAFVNTDSAEAWSIQDIILYLRDFPDLYVTNFELRGIESIKNLLIEALEHCAKFLPD